VLAVEDPEAVAARARQLRIAAAGLSAAFVLALVALWYSGRSNTSPPSAPAPSSSAGRPAPGQAPSASDMEPPFAPPIRIPPVQAQTDLQQSLSFYERAVRDRPGDANALASLARAQVQLGQTKEAIATLQTLTDAAPFRPEYWLLLAHAQCTLSRWDECIGSLRKAQELTPDDPAVAHNLGVALHRRGSDAAAIKEYERARTLRPADPATHLGLAVSYDRLGQPVEAIAAYREYLRLLPGAPAADKINARIATLSGGAEGR
jgi:Flp pilus assembly protein TadD